LTCYLYDDLSTGLRRTIPGGMRIKVKIEEKEEKKGRKEEDGLLAQREMPHNLLFTLCSTPGDAWNSVILRFSP
jgi:hypothetical protein